MYWKVLTHTHTYSGRSDHGGAERPPGAYEGIAKWCARCGIDALGMGSPYTPSTAAKYGQYEGVDRELYYSAGFDKRALLVGDDVPGMLEEINRAARGRTLFYLDNETPKGRYGHMWWVGHTRDMPEWHDYDQPFDRWMVEHSRAGEYGDEPMAYERRPYLEILAIQRAGGGLGFWAHPTSWWTGERGQFVTNIASEMPAHAIAEGGLDGMVVMGYHPYRPQYKAIWFALLDRGYRVPGVAEMDASLSHAPLWQNASPMLTHVHHAAGAEISVGELCKAFGSGRMIASNGPLVELTVDGQPMGRIARTGPDIVHDVRLTARSATPGEPLARVELLGRGGELIWHRENFPSGTVDIRIPGSANRGYLIACVFGDFPESWRAVKSFAISNPVYLHPPGMNFERPATTTVNVHVREDSPAAGGEIRFEAMNGDLLASGTVRAGVIRETMPAGGRVTVVFSDGRHDTWYLVNANRRLTDVQRYLYRGKFRVDFPSLTPGELPPEAWRLDDYVAAMREVTLEY